MITGQGALVRTLTRSREGPPGRPRERPTAAVTSQTSGRGTSVRPELGSGLVEAMSQASFYPHEPGRVELIETHISWVFVAGDLVYKVKKPVVFPCLLYTSPSPRDGLLSRMPSSA